jgi:hypothetical protein
LREIAGENLVRGIVLYDGEEAVPFGEEMVAVPVGEMWGRGG